MQETVVQLKCVKKSHRWHLFIANNGKSLSWTTTIITFWFENNHPGEREQLRLLSYEAKGARMRIIGKRIRAQFWVNRTIIGDNSSPDLLQYILLLIYMWNNSGLASCTCHNRPRSHINKTLSASFNLGKYCLRTDDEEDGIKNRIQSSFRNCMPII